LIGVRATRDIGFGEAYLYVPLKMTINEETFKNCEIKDIYFKNEADFYDRDKPEHFVLIFFVTY